MKKIAVLLTVFNRKEITLRGLESLFRSINYITEECSFDIYMVDDGSTDGTSDAVKELYSDVVVLKGNGDLFWNGGMIHAWVEASKRDDYDAYLWYNDDSFLYESSLVQIIKSAERNQWNSVIVGSMCSNNDDSIVTYGGRDRKGSLLLPDENKDIPCFTFNGNLVLIPRSVYKIVGVNDKRFRHSYGDWIYGLDATEKGFVNYIAPGILGKCDRHDSIPVWCNSKFPLKKRWSFYHSPLGNDPQEAFYFDKRFYGLFQAILNLVKTHIRIILPKSGY